MSNLINIRLTKDCPSVQAMDTQAKALGMSRNEMMIKAITMMINLAPIFYKKLDSYSKRVKVPMHTAIQNTIIKRWAQDNAKKTAWDKNKDLLIEFSQSGEGIIEPKELYELVYQMTFEEEAKERFGMLQGEMSHGLEPRGADKAFYEAFKPKYGYKPKQEQESLVEGMAYWEGEMTDEEALELFKAKR